MRALEEAARIVAIAEVRERFVNLGIPDLTGDWAERIADLCILAEDRGIASFDFALETSVAQMVDQWRARGWVR